MKALADLETRTEAVARRNPFPVDVDVYRHAGRDPLVPILATGSLDAPVCSLGRDLGKDEVKSGQPQIGAGGRLVRSGVYRALHGVDPPKTDRRLEVVLTHILLTNLVPYKPPGNKAYPEAVRAQFRPLVIELLVNHWTGSLILTLGTEAFRWFEPYLAPGEADAFWAREDRYTAELPCELTAQRDGQTIRKHVRIAPLPHPSPLNRRYYGQFPGLLDQRLGSIPAYGIEGP